ncbi:MAG: hypothetical protein ABW086_01165 [Sedimenticola sp.]
MNLFINNSLVKYQLSSVSIDKSLFLVLIWILFATISFKILNSRSKSEEALTDLSLDIKYRLFILLFALGGPVYIFHSVFKLPDSFENIIHIVSELSGFAIISGILLTKNKLLLNKSRYQIVILLTAFIYVLQIVLPLIMGKAFGAVNAAVLLISGLLLIRASKIKILFAVLLSVIVIAFAMSVKTAIRYALYEGQPLKRIYIQNGIGDTATDKINKQDLVTVLTKKNDIQSAISDFIENDINRYHVYDRNAEYLIILKNHDGFLKYAIAKIIRRFSHLNILSLSVDKTPSNIDFSGKEYYLPLVYMLVPRLIWKDKPVLNYGNKFGRDYGLLAPTDLSTSLNIDPITESWISGGTYYVILSSIIVGSIFGIVMKWLNAGGNQYLRSLVFFATINSIISIHSGLVTTLSGYFQLIGVIILITLASRLMFDRKFVTMVENNNEKIC